MARSPGAMTRYWSATRTPRRTRPSGARPRRSRSSRTRTCTGPTRRHRGGRPGRSRPRTSISLTRWKRMASISKGSAADQPWAAGELARVLLPEPERFLPRFDQGRVPADAFLVLGGAHVVVVVHEWPYACVIGDPVPVAGRVAELRGGRAVDPQQEPGPADGVIEGVHVASVDLGLEIQGEWDARRRADGVELAQRGERVARSICTAWVAAGEDGQFVHVGEALPLSPGPHVRSVAADVAGAHLVVSHF